MAVQIAFKWVLWVCSGVLQCSDGFIYCHKHTGVIVALRTTWIWLNQLLWRLVHCLDINKLVARQLPYPLHPSAVVCESIVFTSRVLCATLHAFVLVFPVRDVTAIGSYCVLGKQEEIVIVFWFESKSAERSRSKVCEWSRNVFCFGTFSLSWCMNLSWLKLHIDNAKCHTQSRIRNGGNSFPWQRWTVVWGGRGAWVKESEHEWRERVQGVRAL